MNYVSKENLDRIVQEMAKSVGKGNGLEDWQAEKEYKDKDICVYEGQIYRAKVGFTSDTTFSTIEILEEYTPVGGETIIPYEKDTEITTGDIVSYDGNDYEALYDFVCGEEFSLYALEEYVPQELTEVQEAEIINHFMPNIYSGGNMSIEDSTPIGTIISFMGTIAPENYLVCDGETYNIVDYIELADFIKEQFGSYDYFGGDGIDTFAVPDLQGEFLRMTGTNSHTNQGSGANVGVHQDGTTFGNTAEIVSGSTTNLRVTTPNETQELLNVDSAVEYSSTGGTFNTFTPSSTESYSGEIAKIVTSRPTNTSVLYCIKYQMSITNAEEIKDLTTADIQQIINAYNPVFDSDGGGTTGAGLEDWKANNDYKENDIFVNQGQIYKAIVDFTSGSTFSIIQILDEYELQTGDVPIAYNKGTSIHIDDIVSYDSNYYIALQNFVCGEEFGLYAFEQYVPIELTEQEETEIVNSFNPTPTPISYAFAPSFYQRAKLFDTNKTTVTVYPMWINIGNGGYILGEQTTIDLTDANNWDNNLYITASQRAGKDFYIFACADNSGEPKFILSSNKIVPTGYTVNNTRLIGGFHCLCVDVGTISGHTLSGYVAGDILPLSVWDLNFRANSDNDGMVYVKPINKWVDIYLSSWDSTNNVLVSKYNQAFITGRTTPAMHGFLFMENYEKVNKILPSYDEFTIWAKGSAENVAIQVIPGLPNPITTGGYNNTAGSRIISNYGIEDSMGVLYQWTRDNTEYSSSYAWSDVPVYNSSVDSVKRGRCYGFVRRLLVGGSWGDSSDCGSRCVLAVDSGADVNSSFGGRGSSAAIIK